MTKDMQAKGWVVAITGCSRGIGRALAEAFSRAGATVVAHARSEAAAREVCAALPGQAVAVAGDLRDPTLGRRLAAAADALGGLDALVLNAAVLGPMEPLAATDFSAFRDAMEINVDAQLRLFVGAIGALRARGGRVVWLTSYLGHAAVPGYGVYCASKHAVEGLAKLAALEHEGDGIISVAVAPGMVRTDMLTAAQRGADTSMHTPPTAAAARLVDLVTGLRLAQSGAILELAAD
ncbi:MAG: hypothetical protein CVU56_07785 [Deltaproteobacteria bacterium HGW-Deltaproteobacteria-14]|jgi:NAD(P)-dependent dehydrogenase (short-subunit alcohol dehydrogenase family)|nr:MAG: hypothetical protein CVU56_07785 [Deltaproteobacteria bacterium HGW-Deltaproteobacteria-14]